MAVGETACSCASLNSFWRCRGYIFFSLSAHSCSSGRPLEAFFLITAVIAAVGWPVRRGSFVAWYLAPKSANSFAPHVDSGHPTDTCSAPHLPETSSVLLTQACDSRPKYVLAEMTLSFLVWESRAGAKLGTFSPACSNNSVLVSYWWMYLPALIMVRSSRYLGLAGSLQERGEAYKIEMSSLGSLT